MCLVPSKPTLCGDKLDIVMRYLVDMFLKGIILLVFVKGSVKNVISSYVNDVWLAYVVCLVDSVRGWN